MGKSNGAALKASGCYRSQTEAKTKLPGIGIPSALLGVPGTPQARRLYGSQPGLPGHLGERAQGSEAHPPKQEQQSLWTVPQVLHPRSRPFATITQP